MGIPEYKAKKYQGRLQKGGILVAVHCETDEEVNRARQVFLAQGAQDLATSREDVSRNPGSRLNYEGKVLRSVSSIRSKLYLAYVRTLASCSSVPPFQSVRYVHFVKLQGAPDGRDKIP
jgi:hypothetical protein